MGIARRIGHISYRSEPELDARFGRAPQPGEDAFGEGRYAVESYLDHHADKLARRFDAGSYVVLSEAMNHHDVGRGRGGLAAALGGVRCKVSVAGIDSDRLYPLRLQQELCELLPGRPELTVIHSMYGHDSFLIESDAVGAFIRQALEGAEDGAAEERAGRMIGEEGSGMRVLVVVGETEPPERLVVRAVRVLRCAGPELEPQLLADVRAHIPEDVAVVGAAGRNEAATAAAELRAHGFPVTLYTDTPPADPDGLRVRPLTDTGPAMEVADSLLDLVGDTPLVRLDRVGKRLDCHLLAKCEFLNAGGSVKDRPAVAMVDAAEKAGLLLPGGTIVEPTSGNTGVGLAIVAARRRYRCVFVMPDKMAPEKIKLLRAYGAEVVVCPTAVAPSDPDSYYSVANRLTDEIPGAYQPNQYRNPENPESHVRSTGPEIWRQTAGRITHFVAGVGTGGTITGVGRYLKSQNPEVQVIGADPDGSVYSGGDGRPYLVEGIGEDFWPDTYDRSVVDRVVAVTDRDSFLTAQVGRASCR